MKFTTGNILQSEAEALVNTVNTVGVMGKGIALQFKERYPKNYELYVAACKRGEVQTGKMFITSTDSMMYPRYIINFPTKQHWMHRSSYAFVEEGLDDLLEQIKSLGIRSIAIPPLGAGQGGLDWGKVKHLIETKLGKCGMEVTVYEPLLQWEKQKQGGQAKLTKARALILSLIDQYSVLGFDSSLLEIQKLAYFLQRMGQTDLKLNYQAYHYGPYAHNLQHLLHKLENGYISSEKPILDSKPLDIIRCNTDTSAEVQAFVKKECSPIEQERLAQLIRLMEGFESPFGLELLATVDWLMVREKGPHLSAESVKQELTQWSKRKDNLFSVEHIGLAMTRLNQFNAHLHFRVSE
jgi:O-acetyl-ADP-ribose deacetylase (regulator of RNase III)